jgi:hypothetical protein
MTAESNRQAIDAMMQQIEDAKPSEKQVYVLESPKTQSLRALTAMTAALAVSPPPSPRRRQSFTEREGLDRRWDAEDRARAGHIAKAKAKRDRKAARRLALASRRQRGEAE